MPSSARWDIFCQVVDNFGDIGVCWRLARQLSAEHHLEVRLWVDDLTCLQQICPETDPQAESQHCSNVLVRHWTKHFPTVKAADVVIEAFGCELPESYLAAMANTDEKPVWINLEYLSAEPWVEGCHALPSPHPRFPLIKYFFFPGFTPATGGLIREPDLLTRRDFLQQAPERLWQWLHLPSPAKNETKVSLFCYENAPIADLLQAWENADTPVRCLLPKGKTLAKVSAHFGRSSLASGDTLRRGSLTIDVVPFMRQEDYDLLLWACDFNFVRGEDSFVRAQWAGKPIVWQIYVQEERAHLVKLDAFLDRYCEGLEPNAASFVRSMHHGWNENGPLNWNDFMLYRTALDRHAKAWSSMLAAQADLASNLVIFCKNRV